MNLFGLGLSKLKKVFLHSALLVLDLLTQSSLQLSSLHLDKSLLVLTSELLDLVLPLLKVSKPLLNVFMVRGSFFPLVKVESSLKIVNLSASVEPLNKVRELIEIVGDVTLDLNL